MIGLTPLVAMCDRWDTWRRQPRRLPAHRLPIVFLHDGYPGDVGITEVNFDHST